MAKAALGTITSGVGGYAGGLTGAGLGLAGGALAGKGIGKGIELYGFLGDPSTHKLLGKAFINTIQRNIPQLTKTLSELNKNAEKYEHKQPINQKKPKYKIQRPTL